MTTLFFSLVGTLLLVWGASQGDTWNLWQISIAPPDLKYGLGMAPLLEGGIWQLVTICATGAFVSWALRQVEICRKLGIGYHVPFAFSIAILAYVHADDRQAGAAGRLGPRLPVRDHEPPRLGVQHRLFSTCNFHYNPAHMVADQRSSLPRRVCALAMHGAPRSSRRSIPGAARPSRRRSTRTPSSAISIGYSIGTLGIHRLGLFLALSAGIWSAICIVISGPLYDPRLVDRLVELAGKTSPIWRV